MVVKEFNYHNRKIKLEVDECDTILQQARGLMFRKKSKPLLFNFKKTKNITIHSFFCKPFLAIWFDNNKIIDEKLIENWKINIKPKQKFNKLLEIPTESKAFKILVEN